MSNKPSWNPAEALKMKQLQPNDTFQFDCSTCCDCCRNVKKAVMVEPLDLFRISKHTGQTLGELSTRFCESDMLAWGFPILMLKTKSYMDSCVFLKSNRCSIHEFKPRVCRLYPVIAGPDEADNHSIISFLDAKRSRNHARGTTHSASDWLASHLNDEERRFIHADYRFAGEFAKMVNKINRNHEERVVSLMLLYRYIMFDLDSDFINQFVRNMAILKNELLKLTS